MSNLIEQLRKDLEPYRGKTVGSLRIDMGEVQKILATADQFDAQQAEIARLRELMGKQAVRFDHCADMIESSFDISGTLRMERALQASAYAFEARAALEQKP